MLRCRRELEIVGLGVGQCWGEVGKQHDFSSHDCGCEEKNACESNHPRPRSLLVSGEEFGALGSETLRIEGGGSTTVVRKGSAKSMVPKGRPARPRSVQDPVRLPE